MKRIVLNVTESEYAVLKSLADADRRPLSTYVLRTLDDILNTQSVPMSDTPEPSRDSRLTTWLASGGTEDNFPG